MLSEVRVTELGDWSVVAPIGDLDLASVPRLRHEVVNLVGSGNNQIVLDLVAVDFMDSVGLGAVVAVAKRVRASGGLFRVARPEPRIWSLFELVGLDVIIDCHDDLESATATACGADGAVIGGEHSGG